MSNNAKALKSGVWYTIANFITKSMVFISTPIFARMLTSEEYGLYSNYTSWLSISTIFVTLNLYSSFISARYYYKDEFDTYILSVVCLSIISSLMWIIIIINIFAKQIESITGLSVFYLNIMMIYIMFNGIVEMFQARERYRFDNRRVIAIIYER